LPPVTSAPPFIRAKSVEEQKSESGGLEKLIPAFRRQHSFEHSLRPVPILEDSNPKDYYRDILAGMGFGEGEIAEALKEPGEKAIEDYVAAIVASRDKKESPSTPGSEFESPPPTSPVAEKDFLRSEKEEKKEELTLSLDTEEKDADWKCRYCNGYVNSSNTEVCIQCNRSRVLCEEISENQLAERAELEAKTKIDEKEHARLFQVQKEELERLEAGPWPCRFCDHSNPSEVLDCRSCGSMKYLSRVLFTDEEWIIKLKLLEGEDKKKKMKKIDYIKKNGRKKRSQVVPLNVEYVLMKLL